MIVSTTSGCRSPDFEVTASLTDKNRTIVEQGIAYLINASRMIKALIPTSTAKKNAPHANPTMSTKELPKGGPMTSPREYAELAIPETTAALFGCDLTTLERNASHPRGSTWYFNKCFEVKEDIQTSCFYH